MASPLNVQNPCPRSLLRDVGHWRESLLSRFAEPCSAVADGASIRGEHHRPQSRIPFLGYWFQRGFAVHPFARLGCTRSDALSQEFLFPERSGRFQVRRGIGFDFRESAIHRAFRVVGKAYARCSEGWFIIDSHHCNSLASWVRAVSASLWLEESLDRNVTKYNGPARRKSSREAGFEPRRHLALNIARSIAKTPAASLRNPRWFDLEKPDGSARKAGRVRYR